MNLNLIFQFQTLLILLLIALEADGQFLKLIASIFNSSSDCELCNIFARLTDFDDTEKPIQDLVKFHCLKANSENLFNLTIETPPSDLQTKFDFSLPFGLLTHGFTDAFPGHKKIDGKDWMTKIALDWAANGVNICAIDWGALSGEHLNYFIVSQINTGRVAQYIVKLILYLETCGAKISEMSAVGHSLGAQIIGKVGPALKKFNKLLKYIYGLDPAGPCYTSPCSTDKINRLNEDDAEVVQCVHANSGIYGQKSPCGCEDFYLNWGDAKSDGLSSTEAHFLPCIIFDWTLNSNNICQSKVEKEILGIHSQKKCGTYHIKTNKVAPYCNSTVVSSA